MSTFTPYDLTVNEIVDVWRWSSPFPVRMRVTSPPDDWEAEEPTPTLVGIITEVWHDTDMPAEDVPVRGDVERVPVTDLKSVAVCEEVSA